MQIFSSLMFGISASLDALLMGISYGLRGVRVRGWQNLIISGVTLLGTCLSVSFGSRLLLLLPPFLAGFFGSLVLILFGVYYIARWVLSTLRSGADKRSKAGELTETCAREHPPELSLWEVFFLSLTLSVNNLGIGLSASMAGLKLLPAAAATFGCSVLFLLAGNLLGRNRLLQLVGSAADPISGILLILLGAAQSLPAFF